ncbi:acetate--CoA ligase [Candidatus Aquiluna sp. UB-MaderosW2red]|uniref:acetate--CoA ligase n=1 Tax=Candidatus Aquiluna sp. UB-MaderosW2red TaxID=1855377 RepID=UPI000875CC2A|nr:acetate--CoA ligase [Candidatus Aquiluna sp. UB-MaderosW2red]SCX14699.1 acetyl-CoA synthetase [Candidatus Aquiluna sp. UB-MaderosW2red]
MSQNQEFENLANETRSFPPTPAFTNAAIAKPELYESARADRLGFWADQANQLHWHKSFTKVLDWSNPPFAKWFEDGELNISYNCLDRHVEAGFGKRVALFFEGEPGDTKVFTYRDLLNEVKKAANLLLKLGVSPGDRVAIYMPMIPEAIIAMQAVARVGAVHSVIFGGFSADSLASRIQDAEAKIVITADGGFRKGKASALKPAVDEALANQNCPSVEHVLVVQRTKGEVAWNPVTDLWWHEEMQVVSNQHEALGFGAEHPLFILYTSGTTGKPKGIMHTTGGYLTQASYTHKNVFDLQPAQDIYWCTADVGWITGHTYVAYGPLANGSTQVIYEGTPDTPDWGRWWDIIQKYHVSIFYTAPTAIRSFMKLGRKVVQHYDLSSIRVLGSVGEPINPEAWMWYREVIGSNLAPIVDTWWQTETGAIMISPLPGITHTKPGSAQVAVPGIELAILDEAGAPVGPGHGGYLTISEPWPAMLRGIWKDPERFQETYWDRFPGSYFAGDGAKFDLDGDLWLLGRVDDVMNVSGHRLSTAEIESALVSHPFVAEAAVVGAKDETTGQAIVAFVILRSSQLNDLGSEADTSKILRDHVAKEIGAIARPRTIIVVSELPKTRSGKIMRRLLRDVAEDRPVGDITTLTDTSVMDTITGKINAGHSE